MVPEILRKEVVLRLQGKCNEDSVTRNGLLGIEKNFIDKEVA